LALTTSSVGLPAGQFDDECETKWCRMFSLQWYDLAPVAAALGCLPPLGKRLCYRPRQSDQFCNQGIFRISDTGCEPTLGGSPPLPLLSFHPLPPLSISLPPSNFPPLPLPFLRSSPLNSATRSWESQPKLNLMHFSLKIRHLVATNLKIFLRIK